ncbi:Ribonuclease [Operophtera brumata]|uniref:Ribonuclease n=1 Tax=Operophtera brumata TaxID=104452 RepID=A0A0L7LFF4_OPEBR|nr:Ribonuclease [Operophtera brumata]
MACKFCGPKLSLCGLILSVWGIIQLVSKTPEIAGRALVLVLMSFLIFQTLMGVFYSIKAVALLEDLPLEEGAAHSIDSFVTEVEAGYSQVRVTTLIH